MSEGLYKWLDDNDAYAAWTKLTFLWFSILWALV